MSMYGKKKKRGFFEKLEDGIRTVSSHVAKPKTGAGSGSGREQGVGKASWSNSEAYKKRRGKS